MAESNPMSVGTNAGYNNCFTLGGKRKQDNGHLLKVPMYIDEKGIPQLLYGSTDGALRNYYQLPYEKADKILNDYVNGDYHINGDESLRISLWLDNAMCGDLHIFVMDFDDYKEDSPFFQAAYHLADKVTRSQSGGYHMFYGVNKETAAPLFDNINLLASKNARSFVCKVACVTLDGSNKVDFFCDNPRLIYEWEPWDNTVLLTDKTQALYELIKDNFSLKRTKERQYRCSQNTAHRSVRKIINEEDCSEDELLAQMSEPQKEVFADLKTISSDCSRAPWLKIGIDILHVFGADLGGSVFTWWSKQSYKYQPRACADAWDYILDIEPETILLNRNWAEIMGMTTNAFGYEGRERKERQIKNELAEVRKRVLVEREATGTGQSTPLKDTKVFLERIYDNEPLPYEPLRFGDLTILPQKGSERFLLPDKNKQSITAYDVIGLLAGDAFKSYRKQIKPLNNKLQILPYSERCRAIFYFQKQYRTPPPIDNAKEIVTFIETALRYITNVQLSQNWRACLDVCNTKETAVSLLAYYGWSPDFRKELPKTENAFYKVEIKDGLRHYEIVTDDIVSRFEAIEIERCRNLSVFTIIKNKKLSYKEKVCRLQAIFQPLLWVREGIRMGLNGEAYLECNRRVNDFIDSLLKHNAFDDISLMEHIEKVQMDKSDPGFIWAAPRAFEVGL